MQPWIVSEKIIRGTESRFYPAPVVIDEEPRLPGNGFFNKFYPEVREDTRRSSCHSECIGAVWAFGWPD